MVFRSAVINAGYRISGTHVNPLGLKTDAPMDVIWDIMRCWVSYFHYIFLFIIPIYLHFAIIDQSHCICRLKIIL